MIFNQLDARNIVAVELVCCRWNQVSADSDFWNMQSEQFENLFFIKKAKEELNADYYIVGALSPDGVLPNSDEFFIQSSTSQNNFVAFKTKKEAIYFANWAAKHYQDHEYLSKNTYPPQHPIIFAVTASGNLQAKNEISYNDNPILKLHPIFLSCQKKLEKLKGIYL